jgi:hypothetical protein
MISGVAICRKKKKTKSTRRFSSKTTDPHEKGLNTPFLVSICLTRIPSSLSLLQQQKNTQETSLQKIYGSQWLCHLSLFQSVHRMDNGLITQLPAHYHTMKTWTNATNVGRLISALIEHIPLSENWQRSVRFPLLPAC